MANGTHTEGSDPPLGRARLTRALTGCPLRRAGVVLYDSGIGSAALGAHCKDCARGLSDAPGQQAYDGHRIRGSEHNLRLSSRA